MGKLNGVEYLEGGLVSGTFTATGQSSVKTNGGLPNFKGTFNLSLWGTFVATVQVERSFDDGVTWLPLSRDVLGSVMTFVQPVTLSLYEQEAGVQYRLNATSYTSGTVNYRISQ
jgi:hypothetical protein